MKTHAEAFLRKRKFLVVLPLLVLPFLALAFWNLGGGQGSRQPRQADAGQNGLNLHLPEAQLKEAAGQDKLSHYEQAKQKARQLSGSPHLLQRLGFAPAQEAEETPQAMDTSVTVFTDPQEAQLNRKLAQLEKAIEPAPSPTGNQQVRQALVSSRASIKRPDGFSQDVDRLEALMQRMGNGNSADDPQLQQLEHMLERILDIQHPGRVAERLARQQQEEQQHAQTLPLSTDQASVTLLEPSVARIQESNLETGTRTGGQQEESFPTSLPINAFYGLQEDPGPGQTGEAGNVVEAAIHETRTLTAGATVKMRLLRDIILAEAPVPAGTLVYGTCRLHGERLHVEVTSILYQGAVLPVVFTAYDLDGQPGLYIPGALTRDAAKQGADRAVSQSLQLPMLSPSVGAQAAGAGIEAAKGLLSRNARQVKVTVTAGHRLLLRDQSTRR
ncbi:conjugative transposon protein TraM [Pontibacter qinzhouensis]|uniref:Conjugative transposon protein TraM n=1 Tax=Pontibacter qinzhouensis TaxID=2603253 RepID=A0A5C8J8K5_9BACT|nr:conjugative transposon protein TraM [Pontibacter qinzhouensis]TXK33752.1 conjugative transposon protein TraM [Pontibacter qinzhouensis]